MRSSPPAPAVGAAAASLAATARAAPRPPSRRRLWRAAFLVVGDAVLVQHETYVLEK